MAFPDDLRKISSNMNTTELWILKEQVNTTISKYSAMGQFCDSCGFTVSINNIQYYFEETHKTITSIERME